MGIQILYGDLDPMYDPDRWHFGSYLSDPKWPKGVWFGPPVIQRDRSTYVAGRARVALRHRFLPWPKFPLSVFHSSPTTAGWANLPLALSVLSPHEFGVEFPGFPLFLYCISVINQSNISRRFVLYSSSDICFSLYSLTWTTIIRQCKIGWMQGV